MRVNRKSKLRTNESFCQGVVKADQAGPCLSWGDKQSNTSLESENIQFLADTDLSFDPQYDISAPKLHCSIVFGRSKRYLESTMCHTSVFIIESTC